jgi:hypothetical protein
MEGLKKIANELGATFATTDVKRKKLQEQLASAKEAHNNMGGYEDDGIYRGGGMDPTVKDKAYWGREISRLGQELAKLDVRKN